MQTVMNRFTGAGIGEFEIEPGANLSEAYLSGANLSGANLSGADLSGANLSGARYSALSVLQANWSGSISDGLRTAMMAFDRDSHPEPNAFKAWAAGGHCPLNSSQIDRALLFDEKRGLYNHSLASPTPWQLWEWIAREFEITI